jgi:PAS domain S-box-containing protein
VLNGTSDYFVMDYECSSPSQERWFKMAVFRQKKAGAGAVIIHSDITERKQTEEALRRSEGWFRLLTDSLPVLISYVDEDHRYRFNNKGYEHWFGHPREYVEGKHLRQVLGEKAYQAIRSRVEAALAGQLVTFEELIPYRGAGRRYVRVTYVPDCQNGRIRGFFALIQDLTERKQAEEEIHESRDKLSTIIAAADVGTWDWNIQAGSIQVNDRFCTMLGYEPGTFGTDVQRFFDSLHPDDGEKVNRLVAAHFAGETELYRCDFRFADGGRSYKWIHDAGRLIERDHEKRPLTHGRHSHRHR